MVHRDIKPGNLIIAEDDVKILDFGLAKFANTLQLTLEGSTLGTVAYMSPEQSRGEEADARSDVWAAGVVLVRDAHGTLPFKGAYQEAISQRSATIPFRRCGPPGETASGAYRIIGRASRRTGRTLSKCTGAGARLAAAAGPHHIPRSADAINAPALHIAPSPRWWRSRAVLAAAALLVVAATGVPFWLFAPVPRVPVVVAPVVNQTGVAELDPYRAALTQELIAELADSAVVRVLPYDRELQILRRFRTGGQDFEPGSDPGAHGEQRRAHRDRTDAAVRERRMASPGRIPRCDDRDQRRCAGDGSDRRR